MWRFWQRDRDVSQAAFEAMAEASYNALPEAARKMSADVLIRVADTADEETLKILNIDDPMELLGLYHGVDVQRKSIMDISGNQDMVFLYRLPILRYVRQTGEPLEHVVNHVLVHELGHHFGYSDDEMHAIEGEDDEGNVPA